MKHLAVQCEDINAHAGIEQVASFHPDVIVVADFGQLLRKAVRKLPTEGAINLHGSLLPALRGAAPVNWAILLGRKETGVTTIRLGGQDGRWRHLPPGFHPDRPARDSPGASRSPRPDRRTLVVQTLDLLAAGRAEPHPQDESQVTLAPPLSKADGRVDWSADAQSVRNRIHGTWPWPGARSVLVREDGSPPGGAPGPRPPGRGTSPRPHRARSTPTAPSPPVRAG